MFISSKLFVWDLSRRIAKWRLQENDGYTGECESRYTVVKKRNNNTVYLLLHPSVHNEKKQAMIAWK